MRPYRLRTAVLLGGWLLIQAGLADSVRTTRGMVVSAHRLASEVGVDVLNRGGNAVDAALATGLALAVVHPAAGNLGGGGFMVVRTRDGESVAFDFREVAPQAAHRSMFLGPDGRYVPDSNHEGYRSVGVPGTVAGFDLARRRFGTWRWRDLAAPAVKIAESGFPLTPTLAAEFAEHEADWRRYPASARVFLKPDGTRYQAGDLWRQPDLARTLKRLAERGRSGFYRGETAESVEEDMRRHGGLVTRGDLRRYRAEERAVVRGHYRSFEIVSMPPPSSGGVALVEALNILEGFDLRALGHNSPAYVHTLAESMRRVFADRARWLGDPDFNLNLPVAELTSKAYAARLREEIRPDRASRSEPADAVGPRESPQTTHYSVVDVAGNVVAVTYTLEYSYGSRIVADGLGFLYNNEMGDFNPEPGRTDATGLIGTAPNLVAPGKRMLSSMSPSIVLREGQPWLVLGSPGGRTIINTVLQVMLNTMDFGMALPEAVAAARVHHQWLPDEIVVERGRFLESDLDALRAKGHEVRDGDPQGSVAAIGIHLGTGIREGVSDPRQIDAAAVAQ